MRHITDGELHAYLDGALDSLGEARGEEIRDHLARCPVCQERLQDEEIVRNQAQALLRQPALDVGPMPSFEDLRALAEAGASESTRPEREKTLRKKLRRPLTGQPLAWAATIVVALGVGWMGGQLTRSVPESFSARIPESDAGSMSVPERDVPAEAAGEEPTFQEAPFERIRAEPPATTPAAPGAARSATGEPVDTGTPGTTGLTQPPEVEEGVRADVEDHSPSALRRIADSVRPAPAMDFRAAAAIVEAERPGELAPQRGEGVSDSTVARGGSLIVPNLEVLSMKWEEWFPGERALHIRQLLPGRDTLELRYLGMLIGTDPQGLPRVIPGVPQENLPRDRHLSPVVMQASLPPGWNQVVMPLERGWLVARAPLPEASLRALVNFIH